MTTPERFGAQARGQQLGRVRADLRQTVDDLRLALASSFLKTLAAPRPPAVG